METYIGFNPDKIAYYFEGRGWPVTTTSLQETKLVPVTEGSALECGDGRFDKLRVRKARGIRIFGGVNALMAIHTGGDKVGLLRAVDLLRKIGVTPGTHGSCGYADLWIDGQLDSAVYPYKLGPDLEGEFGQGDQLRALMRELEGKHFRIDGEHIERATRLNPFRGMTESANDGLRFRGDDWFMADLGIPDEVRFFKIAETVEKLKKDAARLEIIVP